jgi:hypothetical protein
MARLVQKILKGTQLTLTPDATGDCIGCNAKTITTCLYICSISSFRVPFTFSCHNAENHQLHSSIHALIECISVLACAFSGTASENAYHYFLIIRTACRCPYILIQQSPDFQSVEIITFNGGLK